MVLTRKMHRLPSSLIKASQSITLTGLGSETFERAVKGLLALHDVLRASLGDNLDTWTPDVLNGMFIIEFWNRYTSTTREAKDDIVVTLPESVDPFGILRKRMADSQSGTLYLADNQVEYYERQKIIKGDHVYVHIPLYPYQVAPVLT